MPGIGDDIRGGPGDYGVQLQERAPARNPWGGLARAFGEHKDLESFRAVRDVFLTQAEARFRVFDTPEASQYADLIKNNPRAAKLLADEMFGSGGMGAMEERFRQTQLGEQQRQAGLAITEEFPEGPIDARKLYTMTLKNLEGHPNAEPVARNMMTTFESIESGELAQSQKREDAGGGDLTAAQLRQNMQTKQAYFNLMQLKTARGLNNQQFVEMLGRGGQNYLGEKQNPDEVIMNRDWGDARRAMFGESKDSYQKRIMSMTGLVGMPLPERVEDFIHGEVYDYEGEPHVFDEDTGELVPVGE